MGQGLESAISSESYVMSFVAEKVRGWSEEVRELSRFAESQPHAVYCVLTHGLSSCWLFVSQTGPFECDTFQRLKNLIRQAFITCFNWLSTT